MHCVSAFVWCARSPARPPYIHRATRTWHQCARGRHVSQLVSLCHVVCLLACLHQNNVGHNETRIFIKVMAGNNDDIDDAKRCTAALAVCAKDLFNKARALVETNVTLVVQIFEVF